MTQIGFSKTEFIGYPSRYLHRYTQGFELNSAFLQLSDVPLHFDFIFSLPVAARTVRYARSSSAQLQIQQESKSDFTQLLLHKSQIHSN